MPEVLPSNTLSAEALRCFYQGGHNEPGTTLTLRMASRSLVTYTRTTLMATRRPSYVPRDTSAKPPDSTSTEPSEQSGMCMDVGITWYWLHVLQSSLNRFSRSGSNSASFSRRCGSRQLLGGGDAEEITSSILSTCLWISDSEFCRNWKNEAIRGRIFPGCCCWLGDENVWYITGSSHRWFGRPRQPVSITSQMGSRNH